MLRKERSVVLSAEPRGLKRQREPSRDTPLHRPIESSYDEVKRQWVFVMPKMLWPYFLHHRALLGGLARAAWETVRELMVTN